jgi:hypothetical protein
VHYFLAGIVDRGAGTQLQNASGIRGNDGLGFVFPAFSILTASSSIEARSPSRYRLPPIRSTALKVASYQLNA